MTTSRVVSVLTLLLVGLSCGKDSSGPGPLPTGSLVLSPPSWGFGAVEDGANPANGTIAITNGSSGNLGGVRTAITYASNQPTGWLSASLSDTTTPSTLTLNATTGSLRIGSYSAFVAISANGATNAPQIIEVVFLVSVVGVFVSESDPQAVDDATCGLGPVGWGTGFHPCRSITQGIGRAVALGRTKVLVADGIYDESVTMVNGISVLGGHQPDTWQRHVTTTNTVIQGSASLPAVAHRFAVQASNISTATVLEGFVIRGPVNGALGGNSYAIYVSNPSANLTIRQNVIFAGRGGPGSAGTNGPNGVLGVNAGAYSASSYDAFIATGTGFCNTSNNRQLSNGGLRTVGTDVIDGGRGGGNSCPVATARTQLSAQNGFDGNPGADASGGVAGAGGAGGFDATDSSSVTLGQLCVVPSSSMDGANGQSGGPGTPGTAVTGGSSATGSVTAGHWGGTPGLNGVTGGNGGGGGGGGAGGGAICKGCAANKDRLGGHGGGAGSGGGGGALGGGGGAGGGAFGLFITGTAAPSVSNNIIVRGEGGVGGRGGNAGAGGLGGLGGLGGQAIFCTGIGGRGGDGGDGGHDSGGGGGSGGASYGIYTFGIPTPNYCDVAVNNAITGGVGGPGGSGGGSLLSPGGAGAAGVNVSCSFN